MSSSNEETVTQNHENTSLVGAGFLMNNLPFVKNLPISASVAAAVVAGFFSYNEATFKADHSRQTQLILKLFEYDDRQDSQRVNPIRTLHELAVLDSDQRKNWSEHATLKLQESTCSGEGGRRACDQRVDGVFGRGTLLLLTAEAAKQNYMVDLSKSQ